MRLIASLGILVSYVLGAALEDAVDSPDIKKTPAEAEVSAVMQAALDQWLENVEFVCHYRRTVGRAATAQDGIAGNWGELSEDQTLKGVFNKAFGKARVSGNWQSAPKIVNETANSLEVMHSPFDEVANMHAMLSYQAMMNPRRGEGYALFTPRNLPRGTEKHALSDYDAGWSSFRSLSPLSIDGGGINSYLATPATATEVTRSIGSQDSEQVVIQIDYSDNSYRTERQVTFSLKHSVPVVERVVTQLHDPAGARWETVSLAQDFVECSGGPVPKTIRTAFTNKDERFPELPFAAFEWHSDDLGSRQPAPDDFLVQVHDRTIIRGVRNVEAVKTDGKLDLDKVTMQDLTTTAVPEDIRDRLAEEQQAPTAGRNSRVLLLVLVNAVVFVALAVFLLFRGRRRNVRTPR